MYLKFIGTLFLNMLKSVIIPLIIPSLIASIGKLIQGSKGIRQWIHKLMYIPSDDTQNYLFCKCNKQHIVPSYSELFVEYSC